MISAARQPVENVALSLREMQAVVVKGFPLAVITRSEMATFQEEGARPPREESP
jgi:hypothetical protein